MTKNTQNWFMFDSPEDDEPSHAAQVTESGTEFVVEWWNEGVGQVTERRFTSASAAEEWLTSSGYIPF